MKKNLTILMMLIIMSAYWSNESNAQFTLEHTYSIPQGKYLYFSDLGNNNFKYFLIDSYNNRFSIYNLDHSPYMLDIVPGVSLDSGNYMIAYITSTLFDCDSTNIEYVETTIGGSKPFYVFRTDGTQLFKKDSVTGPYNFGAFDGSIITQPIFNTPVGAKLYLMNNYSQTWSIYSLCGSLPESITEIEHNNCYVHIYPNPSSGIITFQIDTPGNIENYEFTIYDALLQKVKTENCNGRETLTIDNSKLSSGNYFFSLQTKNKIIQTGKFIITK